MTPEERRARAAAYRREWYRRPGNREKVVALNRRWRAANPDRHQAQWRRQYARDPDKKLAANRAWKDANPGRMSELSRRWALANPRRRRNARLLRDYGMTLEEHEAMFAAQGELCAICGRDEPGGRGWHTDHDHGSGKVRGILCHHCNLGIGLAKEDPRVLEEMAAYLRKHAA